MSVISRLDEQVEAIIIAPIAGKGEAQNKRAPPQAGDKTDGSQTSERSQGATERAIDNRERATKNHAQPNELPVWLL